MTIFQTSQLALLGMDRLQAAVEQLAAAGVEERGAVFTCCEVVEVLLDFTGLEFIVTTLAGNIATEAAM